MPTDDLLVDLSIYLSIHKATSKADAECVGGYESVLSHIEQRSVTSNYYAVKDVNLFFYVSTLIWLRLHSIT